MTPSGTCHPVRARELGLLRSDLGVETAGNADRLRACCGSGAGRPPWGRAWGLTPHCPRLPGSWPPCPPPAFRPTRTCVFLVRCGQTGPSGLPHRAQRSGRLARGQTARAAVHACSADQCHGPVPGPRSPHRCCWWPRGSPLLAAAPQFGALSLLEGGVSPPFLSFRVPSRGLVPPGAVTACGGDRPIDEQRALGPQAPAAAQELGGPVRRPRPAPRRPHSTGSGRHSLRRPGRGRSPSPASP